MRLSNRDLILLLGVVVAVAISLTAFVYRDQIASARHEIISTRKMSLNTAAGKLLEFIGKHNNVKHSR